MPVIGKKFRTAVAKVDRTRNYALGEACDLASEFLGRHDARTLAGGRRVRRSLEKPSEIDRARAPLEGATEE